MHAVTDMFYPRPLARWRRLCLGSGRLVVGEAGLRLVLPGARADQYADAQIDDYGGQTPSQFVWRPPLRLMVQARASGPLVGTAGFGFWNNPLATAGGLPSLPAAIWFFYASAPSNMPLAQHVPGRGWKAACIDATRPRALAWAPFAPPVVLLNNIPAFRRRIWPRVQRALCISEAAIAPADRTWRIYALEWRADGARFSVDGVTVLETQCTPRGPLGFVAWLDNQCAVVTPRGRFGWGVLPAPVQWLDLRLVQIEPL